MFRWRFYTRSLSNYWRWWPHIMIGSCGQGLMKPAAETSPSDPMHQSVGTSPDPNCSVPVRLSCLPHLFYPEANWKDFWGYNYLCSDFQVDWESYLYMLLQRSWTEQCNLEKAAQRKVKERRTDTEPRRGWPWKPAWTMNNTRAQIIKRKLEILSNSLGSKWSCLILKPNHRIFSNTKPTFPLKMRTLSLKIYNVSHVQTGTERASSLLPQQGPRGSMSPRSSLEFSPTVISAENKRLRLHLHALLSRASS